MIRSSGVLLPVFSLPHEDGEGVLGQVARNFIDFLSAAGQSWWQLLPLGQTGLGGSPYQSPSAFAGNTDFIDLGVLEEEGLLALKERELSRTEQLKLSFERGKNDKAFEAFKQENSSWLPQYTLFMALKKHFGEGMWLDWPDADIKFCGPEAIACYSELLAEDIEFNSYLQYLFFKQWSAIKDYAHKKGVGIIGDMPIYVSLDSADVWSAPELFQLDSNNLPVAVSSVPPDYFSEDGQLWGNPLYDYERMEKDGYKWWIERVGGAARLYDAVRIDHFRGFESYWAVPAGAKTAKEGHWEKGPGMKLLGVLRDWFSNLQFIAEDLGISSPALLQLLEASGFPGMKVLEFAFDGSSDNAYLPHMHEKNSICYIGTHDNDTLRGWLESGENAAAIEQAARYFGVMGLGAGALNALSDAFLRAGMSSVSDVFIMQMQDWLGLGSEARTNVPGTVGGNWEWKMEPGALTKELAEHILSLTKLYGRASC